MTASATFIDGVNEFHEALANDDAFDAWYRRTSPRVYAYLLTRCGRDRALADELLQLTLIAAIDQRSRYDGRSDVVAWLCGIARHKLADHFRRLEREERRRIHVEVEQNELDRASDTRGLDDAAAISETLRSLPAAQRA